MCENARKSAGLPELLDRSSRIAIVSHARPDGDAVGSSLAALSYLESRGKNATVLLPDAVPQSLKFLEGSSSVLVFSDNPAGVCSVLSSCDLLLCLDCGSFSRLEAMGPAAQASGAAKVVIDHHPSPDAASFDLVIGETEISSASELLYQVLMGLPDVAGDSSRLPLACRTALLAGMTSDTNNFNNSVWPSTFAMASDLVASGVDRDYVLEKMYSSWRENRIRAMSAILSEDLEITPEGAAFFVIWQERWDAFGLQEGELEGLVNIPLGIDKVRLSVSVRECGDVFRLSLRSKRGVSSRELAIRSFHGGGHEQASGGKIFVGQDVASRSEVPDYVRRALREFLGGASK
ncbi:MAG: DHH family phosphoesterase [Bacteroidales bacterium]|nr:DHH family phosphoesterase [Bacteroidales bacterium]